MPRPEKVQAVADIKERLEEARAVFVAEYAGLSVAEQQELRRGLRGADGEFQVVKMTLARRAAEELGHDGLMELLTGPTGLAFADSDAAITAKVLRDFASDHERLVIKGALLAGEMLPPEKISELADLEPRDVILAKIAGAMQAPMAQMAGLMAAFTRDLATMLSQLVDQKQAEAGEDGAEAADAGAAAPEAEAAEEAVGEATAEATDDVATEETEESDDAEAPTAEADAAAEGTAEADEEPDDESDKTADSAEED